MHDILEINVSSNGDVICIPIEIEDATGRRCSQRVVDIETQDFRSGK